MERFCDVFDHPHELVVHGWLNHASCNKVANGCRSVVETERKRYRGAPYVVFQREGSSSSKPCHVVGVGKGEAALVLPGLLGPREIPSWRSSLSWLRLMEGRDWMAA